VKAPDAVAATKFSASVLGVTTSGKPVPGAGATTGIVALKVIGVPGKAVPGVALREAVADIAGVSWAATIAIATVMTNTDDRNDGAA
jgi:hypothetical protein